MVDGLVKTQIPLVDFNYILHCFRDTVFEILVSAVISSCESLLESTIGKRSSPWSKTIGLPLEF